MARALAAAGAEPGQLIQIAYGYGLFTGGLGFHDGAEHMGLTVVPVSSGNTLRQILLLQDFRPQGLACTPSFALYIGESLREQGGDPRALGLALRALRRRAVDRRRCARSSRRSGAARRVDFYGLSEIIGPGVAGECVEARDGLHVNEDHFLPEIVDPRSGAPLPAGQEGELVLTSLTKEALPMIRYRTGDVTRARSRALPLRADHRADGAHQGAHRRYADHQGGQRLSLPARGGAPDRGGPGPALPAGGGPAARPSRRSRCTWSRTSAWCADGAASRPRRPGSPRCPRGWPSACGATSGSTPEIAIVAPKTIPRSEGKAVRVVERR